MWKKNSASLYICEQWRDDFWREAKNRTAFPERLILWLSVTFPPFQNDPSFFCNEEKRHPMFFLNTYIKLLNVAFILYVERKKGISKCV